uniref:Uncharacterized protein n=1 Tax=Ditylenchus dipsaci TaxID=166011 RepID=A0A915E5X6_9BILA
MNQIWQLIEKIFQNAISAASFKLSILSSDLHVTNPVPSRQENYRTKEYLELKHSQVEDLCIVDRDFVL